MRMCAGEQVEAWQRLSAELDKIEGKQDQEKDRGSALTMSSAALTDIDMETFVRLYEQDAFRATSNIATRRASIGLAPMPAALTAGPAPWQSRDPLMPAWATPLVRHRELLAGSALVIRRADHSLEFWKMVYMVKSPTLYLALCKLHETSEYMSCTAVQAPRDRTYSFTCNFVDCVTAADVVVNDTDQLQVLFRLSHNGGTHVSSDSYPVSLAWLLAGQEEDIPADSIVQERPASAAKTHDDLVAEMPWLQHLDAKHAFEDHLCGAASDSVTGRPGDEQLPDIADLDEDINLAGLADLEKAHMAAIEDNTRAGCVDFVSRVRGGESQIRAGGEAVHAMQGQCCSKFATAWARRRGLQVTFKASLFHMEWLRRRY